MELKEDDSESCTELSFVALATLLLALPVDASNERFASIKKGLGAPTGFAISEIDHVNLFNGNLVVTLPLGIDYPVGPNLSYGMTLVNNGNSWA